MSDNQVDFGVRFTEIMNAMACGQNWMSELLNQKPPQFSVKTLLYVMTITACTLTLGRILPLGFTQLLICILILGILPFGIYSYLTRLDRTLSRYTDCLAAVGSLVLISSSTTVSLVISAACLMGVPSRSGPVQYAVGFHYGKAFFFVRTLTMLLLLLSVPISTIIGMARTTNSRTSHLDWKLAGIASFIMAWTLMMTTRFFPTAWEVSLTNKYTSY